jgi:hypothetical protein
MFGDGCDGPNCVDTAVARPITYRRARNMLILKYGLEERKYWFLASKIFESDWVQELSNLDSTITISQNIISIKPRLSITRLYNYLKNPPTRYSAIKLLTVLLLIL